MLNALQELMDLKKAQEAKKEYMRKAVARYDARKRAEALGISIEEYLSPEHQAKRRGGKLCGITIEDYYEFDKQRHGNRKPNDKKNKA